VEKREGKAAALVIWATVLSLVLAAGCSSERGPIVGQSGSEGVPSADEAPKVADVSGSSFRVVDLGMRACVDARDLTTERVVPSPATLRAQLPIGSEEFIVLMTREVSLADFPLPPGTRDESATTSAQNARALAIADSQVCALEEVSDVGGKYLGSFLLINAFSAELTAEAAIRLSQRADVRSVELSQTDTPPP
jgi:Peptidase inhibitor I9